MNNSNLPEESLNVLEDAIFFATKAHHGQLRKMVRTPYILHPLEVASIISTMTTNLDTMAAGVLHDVVEDCEVDPREIREKFGPRVAALVQSETEDKPDNRPPNETWMARKEESLLMLKNSKDSEVKIMWLADKLSNMRSFYREFEKRGNDVWNSLNQKDPKIQKWYYTTIAENLSELADTAAYKEYIMLVDKVFGGLD